MERISPGGEAKIKVKVSTKGFGDRTITETVNIYTNDKARPRLNVVVTGFVEKYADIRPPRARLIGEVGTTVESSISIVPKPKYPFKITETKARDGNFINFDLEKDKDTDSYTLTVRNTKTETGRYSDLIYLYPDNKLYPPIKIYVIGNIRGR